MVPTTLKVIRSLPVPAAQSPPLVSASALALLIASRRVQKPLPEVAVGSSRLFTTMLNGTGVATAVGVAV